MMTVRYFVSRKLLCGPKCKSEVEGRVPGNLRLLLEKKSNVEMPQCLRPHPHPHLWEPERWELGAVCHVPILLPPEPLKVDVI